MYAKYSNVINVNSITPKDHFAYKLRQHYHVKLDGEFKLDCQVWLAFLEDELSTAVCRPIIEFTEGGVPSVHIAFSSDASTSPTLGFGATLGNRWIQGDLDTEFVVKINQALNS